MVKTMKNLKKNMPKFYCATCAKWIIGGENKAILHAQQCLYKKDIKICSNCDDWPATAYKRTKRNLCWACYNQIA